MPATRKSFEYRSKNLLGFDCALLVAKEPRSEEDGIRHQLAALERLAETIVLLAHTFPGANAIDLFHEPIPMLA